MQGDALQGIECLQARYEKSFGLYLTCRGAGQPLL